MNGAPISRYIGQLFPGGVDSPHLVLIWAVVAGGLLVGIGIIWEAKRSGHLWTLPTACVFFGVIIEAAATIVLFEFDEAISRQQNDKIIVLETRLAPRILEAAQRDAISASLTDFSGQTVQIASYALDVEASRLGHQIKEALTGAGIKPDDNIGCEHGGGEVVQGIYVDGEGRLRDAIIKSLAGKLTDVKSGPPPLIPFDSLVIRACDAVPAGGAQIFVGIKPAAE